MNNRSPIITIIALSFNHESFCVATLNSINNQTFRDFELIIIDDCSSDESVANIQLWVDQHPAINCTFIAHDVNQGICKSLNEALEIARGKYLAMTACDDIMMPEKLERHINILDNTKDDVAVVYSDAYLMKADGSNRYGRFIQIFRNFEDLPSGNVFHALLNGNFIPAMACTYKLECMKAVGGYDEELIYEDYDMLLRLAKKYNIIVDEKYVSAKYRLHSNNFSGSSGKWEADNLKIFLKHTDDELGAKIFETRLLSIFGSNRKKARNLIRKLDSDKIKKELLLKIRYGIPYRISRMFIKNDKK